MTSTLRLLEFAEFMPEDGKLDHNSLPSQRLLIPPQIELKGDVLAWQFPDAITTHWKGAEPTGALDAFRRVRDGEGALRFAQEYGVLAICEHGLPATHTCRPSLFFHEGQDRTSCLPHGWPHPAEPIDRWLHFARQIDAALRVAAALYDDRPGAIEDWETIFEDLKGGQTQLPGWLRPTIGNLAESVAVGRFYLAGLINEWLALSGLQLRFAWGVLATKTGEAPRFEFGGPFLMGSFWALALQLAVALSKSGGIAICEGCRRPYPTGKRKPQAKRRHYCLVCRKAGIPARDRQRRHREKGPSDEAR